MQEHAWTPAEKTSAPKAAIPTASERRLTRTSLTVERNAEFHKPRPAKDGFSSDMRSSWTGAGGYGVRTTLSASRLS